MARLLSQLYWKDIDWTGNMEYDKAVDAYTYHNEKMPMDYIKRKEMFYIYSTIVIFN